MTSSAGSHTSTGEQTTTIVIFGASGDLTRRKLILSLCSLFCEGRLGPEVRIVGMARSNLTEQEFRDSLVQGMDSFEEFNPAPQEWAEFTSRIHYCNGDVSAPVILRDWKQPFGPLKLPANPPTVCTTWPWRRPCTDRQS